MRAGFLVGRGVALLPSLIPLGSFSPWGSEHPFPPCMPRVSMGLARLVKRWAGERVERCPKGHLCLPISWPWWQAYALLCESHACSPKKKPRRGVSISESAIHYSIRATFCKVSSLPSAFTISSMPLIESTSKLDLPVN